MLKIEKTNTYGWEAAVRGMRNPMNSWADSDSTFTYDDDREHINIGPKDYDLAMRLIHGGDTEAKFLRMIHISMDIQAPQYWWSQFDTYKVGTTANSTSKMHKLTDKDFEISDFSNEKTRNEPIFNAVITQLNIWREQYLQTKDKECWLKILELLPESYLQLRTVDFNYQVAQHMYRDRCTHKLSEWHQLCDEFRRLPYPEFIIRM